MGVQTQVSMVIGIGTNNIVGYCLVDAAQGNAGQGQARCKGTRRVTEESGQAGTLASVYKYAVVQPWRPQISPLGF